MTTPIHGHTYVRNRPSIHVEVWRRSAVRAAVAAIAASTLVVIGAGGASAAVTPVLLGTAGSFVVLAGEGVAATGPNTLNGDLGAFPNTAITGGGSITVTGTNHGGDLVTQGAKNDLVTAYDVAAGEGPTSPIAADLAGQTLTTGIYNSASQVELSGALTLDAAGDPDALFVFQAGSDLIVGPGAVVNLINGAQACNVFWQVTSSASLDTGVVFMGTIMALTSITVGTGSTVEGRLLARNGSVTLDTNTISAPSCTTGVAPRGGVSTGDGSAASASTAASSPLPGVLGVGVLAAVVVVTVRLRRASSFR
ncbi:MAG: DUF3494 domain-containing protein [Demequinaceae bacterium]|nr:DUF3494 domain-containing protein [Demequinaceae bacterium]